MGLHYPKTKKQIGGGVGENTRGQTSDTKVWPARRLTDKARAKPGTQPSARHGDEFATIRLHFVFRNELLFSDHA